MFVRIILFCCQIVDNYLCLSTSSRDATNKASITIPKTPPTKNPTKKPITLPIYPPPTMRLRSAYNNDALRRKRNTTSSN